MCSKCSKECCSCILLSLLILLGIKTAIYLLIFGSESSEGPPVPKTTINFPTAGIGDVLQLYDSPSIQRSALPSSAIKRWTEYQDFEGNYLIPYVITGKYTSKKLQTIMDAMKTIEQNTCIRFRQRNGEHDFLDIINDVEADCFAAVGRAYGRNPVNLVYKSEGNHMMSGCLNRLGVLHELFHSVGLWHEHFRYDHEKYIRIRFDRIQPERWHLFLPLHSMNMTDTYGLPYDYSSIMHPDKYFPYRPKDGVITIETLDPAYQDKIGNFDRNQEVPSTDFYKICSIYQCKRCAGKLFERHITDRNKPRMFRMNGHCPSPLIPKQGCQLHPTSSYFLSKCCSAPEYEDIFNQEPEGCVPATNCTQIPAGTEQHERHCCGGCDQCRPMASPYCYWSYRNTYKNIYNLDCCGRCGAIRRRAWCSDLKGAELIEWENRGFCRDE